MLGVRLPPFMCPVLNVSNLPGYSVLCYSMRGLDIWGLWEGFLMRSDLGLLPGSEIWRGSDFCVVSANLGSRLNGASCLPLLLFSLTSVRDISWKDINARALHEGF